MKINIDKAKYFYDIKAIIFANAFKNKENRDDIKITYNDDFKKSLEALFDISCVDSFELNGKEYKKEDIDSFKQALIGKGIKDCFSMNPNEEETDEMIKKIALG